MKICVTGIAGFLGSHLADRLIEQGHEVIGIDNLLGGYLDNVPVKAKFHCFDLLKRDRVLEALEGCEVVYHCAATAYEGLSVFSPFLITQNISGITASVMSAAVEAGVRRFILCSSMARYGAQQVPFTEDMQPQPQDPYGIAKVSSEHLVRNLAQTHGLEYVIAVPHNIIGPRQKYDDPYRNVASIIANRILTGKPPILYGDGTQMRCFSFVQDVINPLEKLATQSDVVGEVINVGPDEEFITIKRLAEMLCDITGWKGGVTYMPGRPQEVKYATCSSDKARRLLGYKTETSLEQGLREIVSYIKERGPKEFSYHLPLEIINDKTPKTWSQKLM